MALTVIKNKKQNSELNFNFIFYFIALKKRPYTCWLACIFLNRLFLATASGASVPIYRITRVFLALAVYNRGIMQPKTKMLIVKYSK
jgi:hypothetical protein